MKFETRLLAILLIIVLLVSCEPSGSLGGGISMGGGGSSLGGVENRLTTEESKIAVFADGAPHGFWARNDRGNGHPFNCSLAIQTRLWTTDFSPFR